MIWGLPVTTRRREIAKKLGTPDGRFQYSDCFPDKPFFRFFERKKRASWHPTGASKLPVLAAGGVCAAAVAPCASTSTKLVGQTPGNPRNNSRRGPGTCPLLCCSLV